MSNNGGKKSMQHTRLVKCALGAGLVLVVLFVVRVKRTRKEDEAAENRLEKEE